MPSVRLRRDAARFCCFVITFLLFTLLLPSFAVIELEPMLPQHYTEQVDVSGWPMVTASKSAADSVTANGRSRHRSVRALPTGTMAPTNQDL